MILCVTGWLWACCDSLCCRRARFKRSNSVTASVQADLDPEGFPGLSIAVPTQDKSLQFGCSFQRHSSEPESASQYTECHRTVHTQGQWAYREVGPQSCAKHLQSRFFWIFWDLHCLHTCFLWDRHNGTDTTWRSVCRLVFCSPVSLSTCFAETCKTVR